MNSKLLSDIDFTEMSQAVSSLLSRARPVEPDANGYAAYIAYAPRDLRAAAWLERRLNGYEVPAELVGRRTALGRAPAHLRPILRPDAPASGGGDLAPATLEALDRARALIVICSPDAAVSEHVNAVVKRYRARYPQRAVAPVIARVGEDGVEGALPLSLRFEVTMAGELSAQPMVVEAADLREAGDGPELALAKIVASLIAIDPDELYQRTERLVRRRQRAWIMGLSAAAALCFGGAFWSDWSRRAAVDAERRASAEALLARSEAAAATHVECALQLAMAAYAASADQTEPERRRFRDRIRAALSMTRARASITGAPTAEAGGSGGAFAPGSADLAFALAEGGVATWPSAGGGVQPFGALSGQNGGLAGPARGLAWSARGDQLAVLRDGAVEIWSEDGRRRLRSFNVSNGLSLDWSPAGDRLIVIAENSGVFLLDLASGAVDAAAPFVGAKGRGAAWSPDGARYALGAATNRVEIRAAILNDLVVELEHSAAVVDLDWSPSGDRIAVALDNGQVWIWDPAERRRVESLNVDDRRVEAVAFSPDGRSLATGAASGKIRVWSAADWTPAADLFAHSAPIASLVWREDGAEIASFSRDGSARVWAWRDGVGAATWTRLPGWIWDVALPGEGDRLTAVGDALLLAGRIDDPAPRRLAFSTQFLAGAAAVDAPLYAAIDDQLLAIRDVVTEEVVFQLTLDAEIGRPLGVALAPDGSFVSVGSLNGVFVWSVPDFRQVLSAPRPTIAMAFSPDAKTLAHYDLSAGVVRVLDIATSAERRALVGPAPDKPIWGLAFSRRGDQLAAASDDGAAHLWRLDAEDGAHRVFVGHSADVKDVAWARGDSRLATASLDGTVRIWDVESGEPLAEIAAHDSGVRSLAWSGDGLSLVTGGEDGRVRRFATRFEDVLALAESQSARGLTAEERKACLGDRVSR